MFGRMYQVLRGLLPVARQSNNLVVRSVLLVWCGLLTTCAPVTPLSGLNQTDEAQLDYGGKKILFVNSYHQGYEWSDGIETGLRNVLEGTRVELKIVRMDTKRNTDDEFRHEAALRAKAEIETFEPDVVIASDDNAQSYLVVPYLKDTSLPVVFCGVNWDASIYGYPASNVTGMVEVELPTQLIEHLETYAQGGRIGYITVDSVTERKTAQIYNERFFNGELKTYWTKTLAEFLDAFVKSQAEVDILFIGNNAGIDQWNPAEVEVFITENTRIPTGTINPWMAPYSLITLAKKPEEQGEWAAQTALRILDGTPVSEIPLVENEEEKLILNLNIAEQLEVVFEPYLLKNAEIHDPGKED